MNVRVRLRFESPGPDEMALMRSLAGKLTNRPESVQVSTDAEPGWLVAEFTMPTEAQYVAVPKIDRAIRYGAWQRLDSAIFFPASEAERARARRKAEKRRNRRRKM